MAFRFEAFLGTILICGMAEGAGAPVRHRHWHGAGEGTLEIGEEGLAFRETRKHPSHSRTWRYADIQQLVAGPHDLRVLTYDDAKWQLGRDIEFRFEDLPGDFAARIYPDLRAKLGGRAIAAFAADRPDAGLPIGAKLLEGRSGWRGTLRFGAGEIAFSTPHAGHARTWQFADIDNLSREGPHQFALTVWEKSGLRRLATREYRFELQQPLSAERYDELWRSFNRTRFSSEVTHHD